MILNKETARKLSQKDFANIVDIRTGFAKEEIDGETGLRLVYMKNPATLGDDSMAYVSHAVAAIRGSDIIFSAALESIDLRALSSALGESLKSLQAEYGVKKYFTEPRIIIYGNGEREDLGRYLGAMDDGDAFDFLRGLFEDSFPGTGEDEDWSDWIVE